MTMFMFKIAISAGDNLDFVERALEAAVEAVEKSMDIPGVSREVYRAWVERASLEDQCNLPVVLMTKHGATRSIR